MKFYLFSFKIKNNYNTNSIIIYKIALFYINDSNNIIKLHIRTILYPTITKHHG